MKRAKKPSKPRPRASSRAPLNRLVLFVKEPRMGRVKGRLAEAIGGTAALKFYRGTLAETMRLARDRRWRTAIAVTPDRTATRARLRGLVSRRHEIVPQGRGDIGRRMARAFSRFKPEPTIIVGSDIPGLKPGHIARAFQRLREADVVLGPAGDGGFWLVGLRRGDAAARLFSGVRWSSAHALSDVRARLPRTARVAAVEMLEDVDDGASYRRWRQAMARG